MPKEIMKTAQALANERARQEIVYFASVNGPFSERYNALSPMSRAEFAAQWSPFALDGLGVDFSLKVTDTLLIESGMMERLNEIAMESIQDAIFSNQNRFVEIVIQRLFKASEEE